MFREGVCISSMKAAVLGIAVLVCPCAVLAQRGGAGRGAASTSRMDDVGRPTGVETKDDLKDFHAALAVQANSQQILAFDAMLKSTSAASAEVQAFVEQLNKQSSPAELAGRGTRLDQALETARSENRKFLEGLSPAQKTGLQEIAKRLAKADAKLEEETKALDQQVADAKAAPPQIANLAQNLERALAGFRIEQLGLGEEMSISDPNRRQDFAFDLPPMKNSVSFASQPIEITTSGVISKGVAENGESAFTLQLTADLSDLQHNMTEVLRTQLDQSNRCGERVAIQDATLTPLAPASLVTAQLHYERWACLGRDINEMAEGNGTIEVKLTPAVAEDGTLRLAPEIVRIDAQGLVGDLLRSGSLGEVLRDKIKDSVLVVVRPGGDLKAALPAAAQGNAALRRAEFQGTGSGRLMVVLQGEVRISNDKVSSFTGELKERSSPQANVATEAAPR
jgi:hypothetical protein